VRFELYLYIMKLLHLVGGSRNGWSNSGPRTVGTECPRNLVTTKLLIMVLIPC